ncbi:3-dehydroquinate dehydratase [Syntrophus gentianae]|uniref:3-dehydroquinate dehydratase n=1 Tax=Syntrophus gentianae TaxID=43775 RepID=A0A1H7W1Z8_9BACT|nr:type I 3-dehydroquinate dehydratase [Syntrophus gentianae]SEM15602.1 3-dehydroquinate dehydratase [Syntrophus gentianae]
MSGQSLEELRESIQNTDTRIVDLLNERAALALEIGRKKADLGMEIYDPVQEEQVYGRLAQFNNGPMPVSILSAIFGQVVAASRYLQNTLMTALLPGQDWEGLGRVKVCIPVVGPGSDEALKQISAASPLADLLELRMDLISGGNLKDLVGEIRRNPFPVKIVVTHRKGEESGLSPVAENSEREGERIAVLQEAILLGVDYVDIELSSPVALRETLKSLIGEHLGRTQLIVSCHDFSSTPSDAALEDLWRACREAGARVIKIVTFARTMADNLRVLRLIPWSLGKGQEIVAFSMGELGKISRILAPLLGAHFTFASLEKETATAPGQLTAAELFRILEILGGSGSEKGKKSEGSAEGLSAERGKTGK